MSMGPASTSRGKKKETEYKYTKLSELPPNSKATNVYGVIGHLRHCKDIKMVLYDESEIPTPTYCELALNNTASNVYGNFPLSTDMIVRIHRCPTKVKPNGQKILYGTIGNAGLHILAWCIDDDDYRVRCQTSITFTINPDDHKRINELRQFWKRRMGNDTYGRTIFFHSISNESENNGQERGSQMLEGPTEQEHHEGVEMEANAEQESIDEIVLEEDEEEQEEEEENGEEPETAEESEEIGDDFFAKLRTKLAKWKKGDINQFASLLLNQRKMEFCNINCQILSILLPHEQFQHDKPPYLRVSDGTKASSNGIRIIYDTHRVESDLFDNKVDYERCSDYIRLVSIWDEFQPIALQMKPGDIIELRNLHAKISPEFGTHLFPLRGVHGPNVYNRGIKLLERPAENEAIQENEVSKGQEGNEPPKKKDKKGGEDELGNSDSGIVLDNSEG